MRLNSPPCRGLIVCNPVLGHVMQVIVMKKVHFCVTRCAATTGRMKQEIEYLKSNFRRFLNFTVCFFYKLLFVYFTGYVRIFKKIVSSDLKFANYLSTIFCYPIDLKFGVHSYVMGFLWQYINLNSSGRMAELFNGTMYS